MRRLEDLVRPELKRQPTPGGGLVLDSQGKVPYGLLADAPSDGDMLRYVVDATSGEGTWEAVGAVQVVTAIADATAYDGAVAHVRTGSSPYDFTKVTYNDTLGSWVSEPVAVLSHGIVQWTNVSSPTVDIGRGAVIGNDCNAIYDAGLRPQFMGGYRIWCSDAAQTAALELGVHEFVDNEQTSGTLVGSKFFYGEQAGDDAGVQGVQLGDSDGHDNGRGVGSQAVREGDCCKYRQRGRSWYVDALDKCVGR